MSARERLMLAALLLALSPAAESAWNPTRLTSPTSVAELKSLQDRVTAVVASATPATVGLLTRGGAAPGMLGAGSGVIVSESGLILTAAHVIGRPGERVTVVLADGTRVMGKTLGVNPKVDSGMVQITDKPPEGSTWPGAEDGKWPFAEVGVSKGLKAGQWLVALGHPGGPKKDRPPAVRVGRMLDYLEREAAVRTDCTLVGGDSGGPLFDLTGKVVGVHSRIGAQLDHNVHVATEFYKDEWDSLAQGLVTALLGTAEMGLDLASSADQPTVKEVRGGGPAAKAGFKAGDAILAFDGEVVHTKDDLRHLLDRCYPGDEVELEVRRGRERVSLTVVLGKRAAR